MSREEQGAREARWSCPWAAPAPLPRLLVGAPQPPPACRASLLTREPETPQEPRRPPPREGPEAWEPQLSQHRSFQGLRRKVRDLPGPVLVLSDPLSPTGSGDSLARRLPAHPRRLGDSRLPASEALAWPLSLAQTLSLRGSSSRPGSTAACPGRPRRAVRQGPRVHRGALSSWGNTGLSSVSSLAGPSLFTQQAQEWGRGRRVWSPGSCPLSPDGQSCRSLSAPLGRHVPPTFPVLV